MGEGVGLGVGNGVSVGMGVGAGILIVMQPTVANSRIMRATADVKAFEALKPTPPLQVPPALPP